LAWRSAQRLLFLYIIGKFAERLICQLAFVACVRPLKPQ
jgi:hypothetical protein